MPRRYVSSAPTSPDETIAPIYVRTDKHPITGCQTIGVAQVAILISEVTARTDGMDMQPRARRYVITFDFIAQ